MAHYHAVSLQHTLRMIVDGLLESFHSALGLIQAPGSKAPSRTLIYTSHQRVAVLVFFFGAGIST